MATWQHLRSSTAHKRPTTSLADGRIAINTNTASPGLFFKDSAGTGIVKVGPVHVGTSAPNASPAAGGSSGNYLGEQWLDTSLTPAQLKVWNGSAWVGVVADELPVSKLQDGQARQLLQTDAAGTGVEWTSNVDVPGTLDVTGATTLDSTLTVPLGSAAAPTVRFTGDSNTGIYSPGADQLALSTNGTGRLFVDASGNVGIGTSAPDNLLHLHVSSTTQTASSDSQLVIEKNNNSGISILSQSALNGHIYFGDIGDNDVGQITYNHSANYMQFTTDASERLRITSAGRLLVGTSSDSGGALLQVNGNRIRVATAKTPASASDTGTAGEICWDASYIYVCTATNTWKRTALSTW